MREIITKEVEIRHLIRVIKLIEMVINVLILQDRITVLIGIMVILHQDQLITIAKMKKKVFYLKFLRIFRI